MALKKFDVPDIDSAISEAREDEKRSKEIESAERLAAALETFIKNSPVVVKAMKEIALSLMPGRFSSQVDADMKKSATECVELFKSKVKPTIDRMETKSRRIAVPPLAVYIVLVSLLWLFAFLCMVIYANTAVIHSDHLTSAATLTIILWILTVAIITYLTRKFKF